MGFNSGFKGLIEIYMKGMQCEDVYCLFVVYIKRTVSDSE